MEELIKTVGYVGLFAIVFAESGLLIGFFLPGDSLLFTAGFLASQNVLSLPILLVLFAIAAVVGDSVGYTFGRRVGRRLFERGDSMFFKKKHLIKAEEFYEKHGSKTIIIARFMPIVRTFAPIVAGIALMNYRRFVTYNIVGGLLWACGVTLAGYFLGNLIPDVDKYLLPIIVLIVLVSVLPSAIHLLRDDETRADIMNLGRRVLRMAPAKEKNKPSDIA
jgi:membrane-associated protein